MMNLYFTYRWWLALGVLLIIISAGIYFDLSTQYTVCIRLKQNKQLIINNIKANQHDPITSSKTKKLPHYVGFDSPNDLFNSITNIIHLSSLKLHALTFSSLTSNEASIIIHLETQGNYLGLTAFLNLLTTRLPFVFIKDFNLQDKTQTFNMDLLAVNGLPVELVSQVKNYNLSAFCSNSTPVTYSIQKKNWLHLIPVDQLRLIGYLQQGEKTQALAMLPNGVVITIHKEELIGKEQARVKEINPNGLIIQFGNQYRQLALV